MKSFLIGVLLLPALLGSLVIHHTFIAHKSDGQDGEIRNRIARLELVWLAMNQPHLFLREMPQVAQDVEDRHGFRERTLVRSGALDVEYFVEANPDLAREMLRDPEIVTRYWLDHLHECRPSAPGFDVRESMARAPELARSAGGSCERFTWEWAKRREFSGESPAG